MWTAVLALGGMIFSIWAAFRYLILIEIRIDANTYKTLYEFCKNESKFLLHEEFSSDSSPPITFAAICFIADCPWFYINHTERLLTAGFTGKDTVTNITCFRWSAARLKDYLKNKLKELQLSTLGVPVELITPYYTDRIGSLKDVTGYPWQPESVWLDFDKEVTEVFSGARQKTSALLYGPPGNGKTSFVKHLATKNKVPIKIITFDPKFSNHDLMRIFSKITPNCIVLFEDFDNYFSGRNCIIGNGNNGINFTFDIILNGLDGVYNTYEGVVFIMTVNDIAKVDYALKNRPSRFKFVREFANPPACTIKHLLCDAPEWMEAASGMNLDQLLRLAEYRWTDTLEEALRKLGKQSPEEIRKKAHLLYLEREKAGIAGTPEADWEAAKV